nr:hypothetical protein [Tanacetum cinerariifolium]
DPFPKSTEFNADGYATLVAHLDAFWKFPEPFLCLIGMSRNYTLDEDTYPTFLHDDRTGGCLPTCIVQLVADPTKVKVGEREHVEGEARLLDSTVGRVVPLLPVALARTKSELEASMERLFDEGGSADQGDSVVDSGQKAESEMATGVRIVADENVGDHGASSKAATSGKSPVVLRELLARSMLNVKAGVATVATLPMVISSVSATPKHENSSHHSSTNAAEVRIDSFVRSVTPPSLMSKALTTTNVASIPFAPALETGTKVNTLVHALMFLDSDSTGTVKPATAGSSHAPEKELSMGSRDINSETLHDVFVPQWNLSNDSLFDDHDETGAAEAIHLHAQVSAAEATEQMHASPLADAPGMSDLQPHVDQLILLVHRSEDQVVLRETSLSFSLNVTHSRVERIRENVAAKLSALIGVWTPLVDPLSVENLIGETDTSDSMPVTAATTTALSVIFAFASTVPPITIEEYKIMGTDGPEDAKGSGQAEAASFPNTVEFEKEELDTTPDRDRTSWTILVTAPTCFSLLFLCTAAVCGLFVAVFVLLDSLYISDFLKRYS